MSVNKAWQGKRFKTKEYKAYERELLYTLPKIELPEPPYSVSYSFGFSNSASDIDNPVKLLQDILQKKYGFNDRDILEMYVRKHKVSKGLEWLSFEIRHFDEKNFGQNL